MRRFFQAVVAALFIVGGARADLVNYTFDGIVRWANTGAQAWLLEQVSYTIAIDADGPAYVVDFDGTTVTYQDGPVNGQLWADYCYTEFGQGYSLPDLTEADDLTQFHRCMQASGSVSVTSAMTGTFLHSVRIENDAASVNAWAIGQSFRGYEYSSATTTTIDPATGLYNGLYIMSDLTLMSVGPASVPEPATFPLMVTGLLCLVCLRLRMRPARGGLY